MGDSHPSDDALIASIASGDSDAFAELYERHRSDIRRFAVHMCGSATLAEDIVHEAFVAVIQSAARYRPGQTDAKLWLLGIARNFVRRARSARLVSSLDDEAHAGAAALRVEHDPLGDLARRQDVASLRRAILALPARYREAVVLCDLNELSYADAAATLRCALGTVRSRLHRGRTLLARRLCGADESRPCSLAATRMIP